MGECNINTHNFCCVSGDTQFSKEFIIEEATGEWELLFNIYSAYGVLIKSVELERLNATTWQWVRHRVELPVGGYNYTLCYHYGDVERMILRGKIIVKNHL